MDISIFIIAGPVLTIITGALIIARYTRRRIRYRGIDDYTGFELTKKIN